MDNQQPSQVSRNCIIYRIVNVKNGKCYVGQTRQGLSRRKAEHISRLNLGERDHKLYLAMKKHGVENFKFEVLCHCLKPQYMDELEILFIERFNSFNRGYNATCGGNGVSDETREKMRQSMIGRKITWYDKIVAARRAKYGPKMAARSQKETQHRGAAHVKAKSYRIKCPDGQIVKIKGLNQFCKQKGIDTSTLLGTLTGRQIRHKGYTILERFND